jgi:hypothetical protein
MQIAWRLYTVFPACRADILFAAELVAARALVVDYSTKQGNGTGKLIAFMADFNDFPYFGEAGHGI